jgi:hypothetical protein
MADDTTTRTDATNAEVSQLTQPLNRQHPTTRPRRPTHKPLRKSLSLFTKAIPPTRSFSCGAGSPT